MNISDRAERSAKAEEVAGEFPNNLPEGNFLIHDPDSL